MRNTRLLVLFIILGGLAVLIIPMSVIFAIHFVDVKCLTPYGEDNALRQEIDEVNAEILLAAEEYKLSNIFLLNEQAVLDDINSTILRANAADVECFFPNKIVIYYTIVTQDIQIKLAENDYLIAGECGKILSRNSYDSTLPLEHYNDSLVSVIPFGTPNSSQIGTWLYSDPDCFDMNALSTIFNTLSSLEREGVRAIDKASLAQIDLSSQSTIYIKMRTGVTFKLLGGLNNLHEKVKSMISWYVFVPTSCTQSGTATISDVNPENIYYSV